eukprot:3777741-Prymnesium_polylepis.1
MRCVRWSVLVWENWFLCGMVGVGALRYVVRVFLLYRSKCAPPPPPSAPSTRGRAVAAHWWGMRGAAARTAAPAGSQSPAAPQVRATLCAARRDARGRLPLAREPSHEEIPLLPGPSGG